MKVFYNIKRWLYKVFCKDEILRQEKADSCRKFRRLYFEYIDRIKKGIKSSS